MRILVHEHVSAGGLAGRSVPVSLVREGRAMRAALVADLAAAGHDVVADADPRLTARAIESVDAVWLIAPETGGVHERLARRLESRGALLLGSSADAIRHASHKGALARLLKRHGIPHPDTRVFGRDADPAMLANAIGYPVVVKPVQGAGCAGVSVAFNARELRDAIACARVAAGRGTLLMQRYVAGVSASVSLLADGTRAVPLTLNRQRVTRRLNRLSYEGGQTPFDHPMAARALEHAARVCALFPGLRGFVGVDLVLTDSDALVIEVNPRLTTAYLGVREALGRNVAALALAACLRGPDKVRATGIRR